jgi:methylglutaconyl-CoA hydratase
VITTTRSEGVLTVTLARHDKKNAFDRAMVRQIREALAIGREDAGVRVLTVRSAVSGCFSVGMDLDALADSIRRETSVEGFHDLAHEYIELLVDLVTFPRPTVIAVEGLAVGGGVDLTAACDLAIASEAAAFSIAMLRKGIFPMTTSVVLTPRIGEREFFVWLASGVYYGAKRARHLGLVSEVVSPATFESRLAEVTGRLAGYQGDAMALGIEAIRLVGGSAQAERLRRITRLLALNMKTPKRWISMTA